MQCRSSKLRDAGYSTVAPLAHALPSLDDLEAFLESLLGRASWSQRKLVTSQRLVCRALVVNQVPQGTREAAQPNLVEDQGRAKATLLPEGPYRSSRSGRTGTGQAKEKERQEQSRATSRKKRAKERLVQTSGRKPARPKERAKAGQRARRWTQGGVRHHPRLPNDKGHRPRKKRKSTRTTQRSPQTERRMNQHQPNP